MNGIASQTLLTVALVLGAVGCEDLNRPIKWYDAQGNAIVEEVQDRHAIPKTSENERGEIYTKGWAYKENGEWFKGSQITIYGIAGEREQDDILATIKRVLDSRSYKNVRVTFCDAANYEVRRGKRGTLVKRLPSKEARVEIVK